jgi:hypothetical protein
MPVTPIASPIMAYPNPVVAGRSHVPFSVETGGEVVITISDVIGRYRKTLYSGMRKPGRYWTEIDATDLSPGIYLIEQRVGGMLLGRGMLSIVK